jgi:hypothetical protein
MPNRRGIHKVGAKYLPLYVAEFQFPRRRARALAGGARLCVLAARARER